MSGIDLIGWTAAGMTMLTFACNDMRRLRVLALVANLAFIAYGSLAALLPVLVLHLVLAPINLWRLFGSSSGDAARDAEGGARAVVVLATAPARPHGGGGRPIRGGARGPGPLHRIPRMRPRMGLTGVRRGP